MRVVRYYDQKSEELESDISVVLQSLCGVPLPLLTGLKAQEADSVQMGEKEVKMFKCRQDSDINFPVLIILMLTRILQSLLEGQMLYPRHRSTLRELEF